MSQFVCLAASLVVSGLATTTLVTLGIDIEPRYVRPVMDAGFGFDLTFAADGLHVSGVVSYRNGALENFQEIADNVPMVVNPDFTAVVAEEFLTRCKQMYIKANKLDEKEKPVRAERLRIRTWFEKGGIKFAFGPISNPLEKDEVYHVMPEGMEAPKDEVVEEDDD